VEAVRVASSLRGVRFTSGGTARRPTGELIGPDMRISQVADIGVSLHHAEQRSEATTANRYHRIIENVVENVIDPATADIRVREATAGRLEGLIKSR
jgi:hypothetical protein